MACSLSITCDSPPDGATGTPYSHTFPVTGSPSTGRVYAITSGVLPPGLSLDDSTGVVSGTPTATGTFPFSITVGVGSVAIADVADGTEQVMNSPDLVTWTARSSPVDLGLLTGGGTCIGTDGVGTVVAIGQDGNTALWIAIVSTDAGNTWTASIIPQPANAYVDICFALGMFVALGADGEIITSSDSGATWGLATTVTSGGVTAWHAIAFGADVFAIVGSGDSTAAVATSPDTTTWTSQDTDLSANPNSRWDGICFGDDQFVCVSGPSLDPFGEFTVMTSGDAGVSWVGHALVGTDPVTVSAASVAFGGIYVAVGSDGSGTIYTSTDGDTWSSATVPDAAFANRVRWSGAIFLIACADQTDSFLTIITSASGLAWTTQTTALSNNVTDVTGNLCSSTANCSIFISGGTVSFGNCWDGATNMQANCFG